MNYLDAIGATSALVGFLFFAAMGVLWLVFPWLLFRRMDRMQKTLTAMAETQAKQAANANKRPVPSGSISGF